MNDELLEKSKKITKAFIALFLFLSSSSIQLLLLKLLHIDIKNITYKEAIPLSCVTSAIIAVILILIYLGDLKKEWKIFKKKLTDNLDTAFKYWLVGFGVMVISNLIINYVLHAGVANNEESVQKMIDRSPLLLLISAGFIAPINEEIVFRKTFKDNIKNKYIFVLVTGLFFGYLHVMDSTTFKQFLYIIPYSSLGISFAMAYYKTDSIFTSMSMHMFHNTVFTLLSILA